MKIEVEKWVEELMAAGCMPKIAARVVTEIFTCSFNEGRLAAPPDPTAEKRRAWDRDRKNRERRERCQVESGGNPVDMTPTQRLWTDGVGLLRQLGVPEKSARSNIGRWLKSSYQPERLLGLIMDAHRKGTGDPIAWVTLAAANEGTRNGSGNKTMAAFDDLIARAQVAERDAGVARPSAGGDRGYDDPFGGPPGR